MNRCGNYSLQFHLHNKHNKELRNSYLRNITPDYSFEIFDENIQFKTVADFKKHIDNFEISDSNFYELNIGDLFITALNAFLYPKDLLNIYECTKKQLSMLEKIQPQDTIEGIWNTYKQQVPYTESLLFYACFVHYVAKLIEEESGLLLDLMDIYQHKTTITPDSIPSISAIIKFNAENQSSDYYFSGLEDAIIFDFYEIVKNNIEIKTCENCGKYFIPIARSDEIYCGNIYKNGKTCKQLGYENRINANEVLKTYRKIYKTQNARKQRNAKNIKSIDSYFLQWTKYAKKQLRLCQEGKISISVLTDRISSDNWMNGGIFDGNNPEAGK